MSQSVFLLAEVVLAAPSFRMAAMADAFLVCATAVCGELIGRSKTSGARDASRYAGSLAKTPFLEGVKPNILEASRERPYLSPASTQPHHKHEAERP